jgi:ABC-2 type transport system permease protein
LALTEFKLKYQGSVIGYLWSLLKPLAIFGVLYLVFTVFVRIGSHIPNYPAYLLLGIVLWNYFAESTSSGLRCIVDKGELIKKVYFPRIVIVLSASVSALITLVLNMIIVAVFLAIGGSHVSLTVLYFIPLVIELYLLTLGLSFFLAALYVRYRDFAHIWEVLLQLLFYASAIIFPLQIIPHRFIKFLLLSPITQIIQDSRKVLVYGGTLTAPDVTHNAILIAIPYLIPLLLAFFGYTFFAKSAAKLAEEV